MIGLEAAVFDADGTLIDTVKLIRHGQYETAKRYLKKHGIPENEIPDYDAYEIILNQSVGGAARHTLETTVRRLYENSPHHLEGMDFDELHDMLNPVQDDIAREFIRPYKGLSPLLYKLGSAGIKLAIFTSGTPHHVVRNFGVALPELGLSSLFEDKDTTDEKKLDIFVDTVLNTYGLPAFTVVTAHDTVLHKPNPASLLLAMERLNVTPDQCLVLGDHRVDMQAAKNAHIQQRVGITHGFDDRKTLETHGATAVVDSLDELDRRFFT